jgi:predicted GNAT family acetyltransferase
MKLQRFGSSQKFWDDAQDYLLQHEAENNLLLGISHTLLHRPDRYPQLPYLAIAKTDNDTLAVAIRTPPHKLLLSKAQNLEALTMIARDLQQEHLPGVAGLVPEVEAFCTNVANADSSIVSTNGRTVNPSVNIGATYGCGQWASQIGNRKRSRPVGAVDSCLYLRDCRSR